MRLIYKARIRLAWPSLAASIFRKINKPEYGVDYGPYGILLYILTTTGKRKNTRLNAVPLAGQ